MIRVLILGLAPVLLFAQGYAGSGACKTCHAEIYSRWAKTRMANVIVDPKVRPEAVIPDFSKADPLLTFGLNEVAFTYGSKWKQRYFKKVGDDYFPLPAQWDVENKVWRAYNVKVGTDWWTKHYPAGNMERPTGPLCDGCHSVNYDVNTKKVTEWNVGCEKCHGPGAGHVAKAGRANIVNPARLSSHKANDVCIQCHSQGKPLVNPVAGKYFDWPVGYDVTKNLGDFWELEEHKLGETTFTHFGDGTGHKNRMQGNDFVQSAMYTHGVTCSSCHDAHGTANNADLVKPANTVCLTCHGPSSANGPRGATLEQHTHHKAGSTGSECVSCHMPKMEQTIANVNVRSHTFKFIPPSATDSLQVPNACTSCHKDKSTAWAAGELKKWPEVSHWRVAGEIEMRILLVLALGLAGFGQEWTVLVSGVSARLRGVSAVNARVAWASGAEGTVLRTADGGTTWKRLIVPGAEKLDFRDVDAVDEKTAYLLSIGPGEASRIYKTRDAGASWALQFQNTDEKAFYDAMTFWDARHGMAVGDSIDGRFVFLFTGDGGAHWERREVPGALAGEGAFAASGTNIASFGKKNLWVGTTAGRVLRSVDGGRTWTISDAGFETGASAGIFSVAFRDRRHGVVVGGDYKLEDRAVRNLAVTEDGGVTWKLGTGMGGLRSVAAWMGKGLVAVGPTGTDISGDGGLTFRKVDGAGFHTFSVGKGGVIGIGAGEKGIIGRLRW